MNIVFSQDRKITAEEFRDLLVRSTLGERRPIDDTACLTAMLAQADLLCTAWAGDVLVGLARSVTDFVYCCYLSDLAVDERFQHQGIGKELIRFTKSLLGPRATLLLLSAPGAVDYYPKIGFDKHPSAWVLAAEKTIG